MRGTHTSSRVRRGAAALTVAVAVALATEAPVAAGGGDWVFPARDRYEAGQTVTMIGYGQGVDAALRARGPFYAWLRVDPLADDAASAAPWPGVQPSDLRLGRVLVEDLGRPVDGTTFGGDQRLSVAFDLPADLPPRAYEVLFCNDPCTDALSTFIAEQVHVGVDAEYEIVRDWPLDDPAIRWLEDDALLALPGGGEITAAEVRAGAAPAPVAVPGDPPATPSAPPPASRGHRRARRAVRPAGPPGAGCDRAPGRPGRRGERVRPRWRRCRPVGGRRGRPPGGWGRGCAGLEGSAPPPGCPGSPRRGAVRERRRRGRRPRRE